MSEKSEREKRRSLPLQILLPGGLRKDLDRRAQRDGEKLAVVVRRALRQYLDRPCDPA